VSVEFVDGAASGPKSQAVAFRAARAAGAQAIGLAPIDAAALELLIADATNQGIPVVAFDAPAAPGSRVLAYIGTNNEAAGQLAGHALRRLLPAGGQVGISLDSLTAANGVQRIRGFLAALAGSGIQALPPIEESYDPLRGERFVTEMVREHPDLIGAFGATGASAANWGAAITRANRQPFAIIGFDIGADSVRMLKDGLAQVVVAQREYAMGFLTVELLCRAVIEGVDQARATLAADAILDTGVDLITLQRTDWSICLADYLAQSSNRRRVDPVLRAMVARHAGPVRLCVIGMAEEGERGVLEADEPFNQSTLIGHVITHGLPLIIDPAADHTSYRDLQAIRERGIRTIAAIPLATRGQVLGALVLESELPDACRPQDLVLLEQIASAVGAAIENVRLVGQVAQRVAELETISQHQALLIETIMEISSPAVPIAKGILVMPLIGVIDSQRASRFMETLMSEIGNHHAAVVLIDISGVSIVDTSVANYLIQAARATRLLGAEVVLVGISPPVAQTIVHLGVDLTGIITRADLESGFAYALARVGGRIQYTTAAKQSL
jgi:ABC-type sugar transport system substrate-binding protein/anti-anti-sigma regulatory factor